MNGNSTDNSTLKQNSNQTNGSNGTNGSGNNNGTIVVPTPVQPESNKTVIFEIRDMKTPKKLLAKRCNN